MKRLLIIILLMISTLGYCQPPSEKDAYIAGTFAFDMRNATFGSKPTGDNPALDYMIGANVVGDNVDLSLGYENFNKIKFDRMFVGLGYHFPLYAYVFNEEIKTTFQPSLEASVISRTWTENYTYQGKAYSEQIKGSFFTPSLNLGFRWDVTDHIGFEFDTHFCPRPDIKYLYNDDKIVISNYFKVVYKFTDYK